MIHRIHKFVRVGKILNGNTTNLTRSTSSAECLLSRVYLKELKDQFQIQAEIEEKICDVINIRAVNGHISIEATNFENKLNQQKRLSKCDTFVGTVSKSITLPRNADMHKMSADLNNGSLLIIFPKI